MISVVKLLIICYYIMSLLLNFFCLIPKTLDIDLSSSADNLAANFSRELADYIIYIIDVSGGDKIPRKGGPGITQADLLVRAVCIAFAACLSLIHSSCS